MNAAKKTVICLNGPNYGPVSGLPDRDSSVHDEGLNGPNYGPVSGPPAQHSHHRRRSLNGPNYGPVSGQSGR